MDCRKSDIWVIFQLLKPKYSNNINNNDDDDDDDDVDDDDDDDNTGVYQINIVLTFLEE